MHIAVIQIALGKKLTETMVPQTAAETKTRV